VRDRIYKLEGRELRYPTHFRDGSQSMGLFAVSAAEADRIIESSGFRVARIAPGTAAMSLVCVHYTDTDCGSYEEIALAFFVRPRGRLARLQVPYLSTWIDAARGGVASYTWCLPVSSTLSRDCGIRMWGFPKTLEQIDYDDSDGRARSTWVIGGKPVLSFSVPAEGHREMREISPPVYSLFEGRPCVSYLTQRYSKSGRHGRDGVLELGDHPAADRLRRLGLPRKPLFAGWNGHLEFEMSHPEPL